MPPEKATVIGATATPHREGNQKALKEFYTKIVDPVTIRELIDDGYLATPTTYSVPVDLTGVRTYNGDYDAAQLGAAYNIAKSIKRRGIKGRPFLNPVLSDAKLNELVSSIAEVVGKEISISMNV